MCKNNSNSNNNSDSNNTKQGMKLRILALALIQVQEILQRMTTALTSLKSRARAAAAAVRIRIRIPNHVELAKAFIRGTCQCLRFVLQTLRSCWKYRARAFASFSSKVILTAIIVLTATNFQTDLDIEPYLSAFLLGLGISSNPNSSSSYSSNSNSVSINMGIGYPYFSRISKTCTINGGRTIAHDADSNFETYLNKDIRMNQIVFDDHIMPQLEVVGPSFYFLTVPPFGTPSNVNLPALSRAWNVSYAVTDHESIIQRKDKGNASADIFGSAGIGSGKDGHGDEYIRLAMDSHSGHHSSYIHYLPPGRYAAFSGWLWGNFGHYMHDHVSKIAWMKSQVSYDTMFLLPYHEIHENVLTMIDEKFVRDRVVWINYGETYGVSIDDVTVDMNMNGNGNGYSGGEGSNINTVDVDAAAIVDSSLTVMVPKANNPFADGYPQTATAYTEHLRQWLEESHWSYPTTTTTRTTLRNTKKKWKKNNLMKMMMRDKERQEEYGGGGDDDIGDIQTDVLAEAEAENNNNNNNSNNIQGENKGKVVFYTRNIGTPRRKLNVDLENVLLNIIKNAMIKRGHSPENLDDDLIIFSGKADDGVTTLSMQRQFEIFSSADTAIGPHGSGLTNIIWMDPRCYSSSSSSGSSSNDGGSDGGSSSNSNSNDRWRPKVIEFVSSKRTPNIQGGSYWGYWFLYGSLPWVDYHQLYYTAESTDAQTFIDPVKFEEVLHQIWNIE